MHATRSNSGRTCSGCVPESLSLLRGVELIKSRGAVSEIWGTASRSPSQLTFLKHNGQHLAAAGGIRGFRLSYNPPVFFALCKHFDVGVLLSLIYQIGCGCACSALFVCGKFLQLKARRNLHESTLKLMHYIHAVMLYVLNVRSCVTVAVTNP